MDQIHLKELNGEIGRILGYYSFGAWIQLTPYLNEQQDPNVTAFHEVTHRDLCFYTSVGHIQLVLASMIRNNPKNHVGKIAALLQKINSNCWNTHEGIATFTSYLNVDPHFQSNIEKIRSQVPESYCYAFDYFYRVFRSSFGIPVCDRTKSFVLFNVATAAMSGKHYFKSLLPGCREASINPNPDQILIKLVEYMEQRSSWREVYHVLQTTYARMLGKDDDSERAFLDITHLQSIDYMHVAEAINTDLRVFYAEKLNAMGVDTYKDGHEWHKDRYEWVKNWKSEFHRHDIELVMPLVFQQPGESVEINRRALTKTRLDLSLSKEPKMNLFPSNYIEFDSLEKYFGEHLDVRNEILIFDINKLPSLLGSSEQDASCEMVSALLYKINSFKNFELIDFCMSVGNAREIHDFLRKHNNVLPIIEPVVKQELEDAVFRRENATSICSICKEFDDAQISMIYRNITTADVEIEIAVYRSMFQFVYFIDVSFLCRPELHWIFYITESSLKILLPEIEKMSLSSHGKLKIITSDEAEERQLFVGRIASEYFAMKISHLEYDNNKVAVLAKKYEKKHE